MNSMYSKISTKSGTSLHSLRSLKLHVIPRHKASSVFRKSIKQYGKTIASNAVPSQEDVIAPETKSKGRMTYKPATFAVLVQDAIEAVQEAIKDGEKRLEVEFPPLPGSVDGYKGASDMYIDSNSQLAIAGAKKLAAAGKKVHIAFPDRGEYVRAYKMFRTSLELVGGISLGHVREARTPGPLDALSGFMAGSAPESRAAGEAADVVIVLGVTTTELPILEDYVRDFVRDRPVILWNLELDTLRGDLGLPAFPPKDLHYRFLSTFRPAFYMRPRDYSKSVSVAPFIVNYSGCLFREYPGPWQVMLKQDGGEYAVIAEERTRYCLGEVKEELMAAMGLNTEAEGSLEQFLRRGYKTSTWYEDDFEQESSHNWRL